MSRPLGRNEAVRPRDGARSRTLRQRPLNGEALSLNLPLLVLQLPADQPGAADNGGREKANREGQHGERRVDEAVTDEGPCEGLRTGRVVVVPVPVAATLTDAAPKGDDVVEGEAVADAHFDRTFHVGWVGMSLLAASIPGAGGRRKPSGVRTDV